MNSVMDDLEPAIVSTREKRSFPRVHYRAYASLSAGNLRYPAHILDLSFNGALVALIHRHELHEGEQITLNIELLEEDRHEEDSTPTIRMQGRLAHIKDHFLGLECRASGIDNQTRLRELLEKHKNDSQLMSRSLKKMLGDYEDD